MILVVDDSIEIVDWLRLEIEEQGYYFDSASDGLSALYKLRRIYYALALIDIKLKGEIQGDALARIIKGLPEPFCRTPLVAITGGLYVDKPDDRLFSTVLNKPFLPKDLKQAIEKFALPPIKDLHMVNKITEPPSD